MENKKLTQDELQEISSLRQEFDSLVGNLGLTEFQILELELQKSEIKKQIINIKTKETNILNSLNQKYGDGSISLETGEFISK
jgi:sucrose-6-phosphate hydrolase SacC (GH32 family)